MKASNAPRLLLLLLQALELELHEPAARSDAARLDVLLPDDSREFGRSGDDRTQADTLSRRPAQVLHADVVADGFEVHCLRETAAVLTHRHRV